MGTFTMATGLGLLAVGLIAIAIGSICFFLIVNKLEKEKQIEKEQKEGDKRTWI